MKTVKAFIKSHPVLSYFVLAFAISWGGILPIIGGVGAIPGTAEETTELFPAVYLVTVAGPSLAGLLLTGLLEELGWTGFAILRLLGRHGVLATGLFVGLLWGAWHFLSNIWGSGTSSGVPLALFMPAILFSFLPPYRMLMVWVYERTESLLVAILMHASLVAFWIISTPVGMVGVPLVTWYLVWAAALWVVVGAVAMAQGGHLSRQPPLQGRVD